MNIEIDDDVPLPQPDKPDTWQTGPKRCGTCNAIIQSDPLTGTRCQCTSRAMRKATEDALRTGTGAVFIESNPSADNWVKAVLIPEGAAECYLVGGPLNGQRGPVFGNDHTVELEVYAADGSVTSVESYALGDKPTPTFRYHVGTLEESNKRFEDCEEIAAKHAMAIHLTDGWTTGTK